MRRVPEPTPLDLSGHAGGSGSLALRLATWVMEQILADLPVTESRATFDELAIDSDENLWVFEARAPASGGVRVARVFARSGELLGSVGLPSFSILEIGTNYVLGVDRDVMGVESVVLFDLAR